MLCRKAGLKSKQTARKMNPVRFVLLYDIESAGSVWKKIVTFVYDIFNNSDLSRGELAEFFG